MSINKIIYNFCSPMDFIYGLWLDGDTRRTWNLISFHFFLFTSLHCRVYCVIVNFMFNVLVWLLNLSIEKGFHVFSPHNNPCMLISYIRFFVSFYRINIFKFCSYFSSHFWNYFIENFSQTKKNSRTFGSVWEEAFYCWTPSSNVTIHIKFMKKKMYSVMGSWANVTYKKKYKATHDRRITHEFSRHTPKKHAQSYQLSKKIENVRWNIYDMT